MDYKWTQFEYQVKDHQGDGRTITGYASTFDDVPDLVGDIIDQGAFKKTVREGGPPKKRIKLLWMHSSPLGMPFALGEDSKGLHFEAGISRTTLGNDAIELMRDGVVDKMSIGYSIIKERRDPKTEINHLKELALHEISPVLFPANTSTSIDGLKFIDENLDRIIDGLAERLDPKTIAKLVAGEFERTLSGLVVPTDSTKAVVPFQDFSLAARGRTWDASAAEKRVRSWADAEDEPNAEYKRAFAWFDRDNQDEFGAYKLLLADVVDGKLTAIPHALFAIVSVMQGGRGGMDVPSKDVSRLQNHVSKYYAKMREEFDDDSIVAPWEEQSGTSIEEIKSRLSDIDEMIGWMKASVAALLDQEPPKGTSDDPEPPKGTQGNEPTADDDEKGDPEKLQSLLDQIRQMNKTLAKE